ncbi:MAG: hypothetical protein HDR03_06830 [Lachnospiraceae bacterium]|nr:hypothetical protein [Lachnospiraceae bacterium]
MINDFKRKNVWWIVIGGVCAAALVIVTALLYGSLSGKSSENQQTQRDENDMEDLVTDLEPIVQENDGWGEQTMDEAVASGLSHEDEEDIDIDIADILKDKTLSILGDSISTYEGWIPDEYAVFFPLDGEVGDVDETWWKMFMDDAGMQFCANSSSSGSTCVGDSLSIDNPKFACSNYRIDDLIGKGGTYPDVIIVYMGTNDCLTSIPIGENDGTQFVEEGVIETFSDAYTLILDKLESQYPMAQIYCCTLTQLGSWGSGNKPFVTFVNSDGLTSEDYSKQIETIASNRGLNVIDLCNCGINEKNMPQYVTDGVHLNTEGMKLVRDSVESSIISSSY